MENEFSRILESHEEFEKIRSFMFKLLRVVFLKKILSSSNGSERHNDIICEYLQN